MNLNRPVKFNVGVTLRVGFFALHGSLLQPLTRAATALLVCFSSLAHAQVDSTLTDTILSLSDLMRKEADSVKLNAAASLEELLVQHYSNPEKFGTQLAQVPYMGQLISPDRAVQMLCWNVELENGNFQYHAVMVHKAKKGEVALTIFEDVEDWERIDRKPVRPSKWYGALYYKILSNKHKGKTYYTILGWDGKDNITNRKVVDVITFQGKSVILGSSMFKDENDRPAHRIIYEYANDVSMALNYDEKEKKIIMDHLAPEDSRFEGQYQFYGPDFSYDALQFKKGKWIFIKDIFAKNRSLNNLPENARPGDFKD